MSEQKLFGLHIKKKYSPYRITDEGEELNFLNHRNTVELFKECVDKNGNFSIKYVKNNKSIVKSLVIEGLIVKKQKQTGKKHAKFFVTSDLGYKELGLFPETIHTKNYDIILDRNLKGIDVVVTCGVCGKEFAPTTKDIIKKEFWYHCQNGCNKK